MTNGQQKKSAMTGAKPGLVTAFPFSPLPSSCQGTQSPQCRPSSGPTGHFAEGPPFPAASRGRLEICDHGDSLRANFAPLLF